MFRGGSLGNWGACAEFTANKKGHYMNKAYRRRLAWLMSHGFNVRRMGRGWEVRNESGQINYNRDKRAVVRDGFREVALGVSA